MMGGNAPTARLGVLTAASIALKNMDKLSALLQVY
ncbi:hypothetical protein SAMN04489759_10532 [Sulfitobacter delicatus]|uniref:Uncharacterized protein n=1 Tax=Sulfitobacter delicatus TaxID=218672 RepID=A0A1G7RXF4_9RHOB|nr:hypothetical protein SAMN04489759_10532 [Sulfitobacter delicatus]